MTIRTTWRRIGRRLRSAAATNDSDSPAMDAFARYVFLTTYGLRRPVTAPEVRALDRCDPDEQEDL